VLLCTLEPRSIEELEGSLLDPNAVTIDDAQKGPAARIPTSSPTFVNEMDDEYFLYPQSLVDTIPSPPLGRPILGRGVSEESAALPSVYFQYKKGDYEDDEDDSFDQDLVRIKNSLAILELNDDTPAAALISTSEKVRVGSEVGRLAAAKEREMTIAADRQARARTYHQRSRIQVAQIIARQRSREGFSVTKQDHPFYTNPMKLLDKASNRNDKCLVS